MLFRGSTAPFEASNWDTEALAVARKAMNDMAAALGFDTRCAFGREDEVRPVDSVIGTMVGWGGLPVSAA